MKIILILALIFIAQEVDAIEVGLIQESGQTQSTYVYNSILCSPPPDCNEAYFCAAAPYCLPSSLPMSSGSEMSNPPLTTISVPCSDIGVWAVQLLCDHMSDPANAPHIKIQVGTTFTLRNSTQPYRPSENPRILK